MPKFPFLITVCSELGEAYRPEHLYNPVIQRFFDTVHERAVYGQGVRAPAIFFSSALPHAVRELGRRQPLRSALYWGLIVSRLLATFAIRMPCGTNCRRAAARHLL